MLDNIMVLKKRIDAACEKIGRPIRVMEVCGTHTVAIFRHGIRSLLPERFMMLTGPGCPVCVTGQGYIDTVLNLLDRPGVLVATYGDMMRVPGAGGSLETRGTPDNVQVVLSAEGALDLARKNPDRQIVFIAVGFETTTPASAVVVKEAAAAGIENFTILSNHKLVVPAMRALLTQKNDKIDAFLCPGHVSAVTGYEWFAPVVDEFKRPCVVAGFEPEGILEGLAAIAEQLADGRAELQSVYPAVVTAKGNAIAARLVNECFEPADGSWRGLGVIAQSTLRLKEPYEPFDAMVRFDIEEAPTPEPAGCRCGEVLCGLIEPSGCGLFGSACTQEHPVGPCMVSSEGACAAWYRYGPAKGV